MRLAYLANFFPSLTETFIYREVIEVQGRGNDIKIYSLRKPNDSDISKEAINLYENTFYLLPVGLPNLLKCHIKFILCSPIRYTIGLWKMLTGTHKRFKDRARTLMHFGEGVVLADRMLKDKISHIHAHFASQSTSVARVIHLLTRIPYSFTAHAHDIWHDQLLLPEKLEEASFAVCCSEFGRQCLLKQANKDVSEKVHLVYHGLDSGKFVPPENNEKRQKNLILSVGSLGETKGFPDLIKACAILREQNFMFRCMIIGEGKLRPELEELINSYKLDRQVKLIGAIPQERIIKFYHIAWVFALPCIEINDGRRDGIPNVLMEAMATGVPVITTKTTAKPELIEDGRHGLLISPHSPVELADSIMKLCEDFNLRKRIQIEARKRMVNDFDSHNTIGPLINLFERFVFRSYHNELTNK